MKPNDESGLILMDESAQVSTQVAVDIILVQSSSAVVEPFDASQAVLRVFPDIAIAFGESDEYSFVFKKSTTLYGKFQHSLGSNQLFCLMLRSCVKILLGIPFANCQPPSR